MYRQMGRSSIFLFKASVSLLPDPSVHNVAVQEGEREGQKAVLLESVQRGLGYGYLGVDVMSCQSIQSARQNDSKAHSGGIGKNVNANRRGAVFSAASASRVLLSVRRFCSLSDNVAHSQISDMLAKRGLTLSLFQECFCYLEMFVLSINIQIQLICESQHPYDRVTHSLM
jgi:hypothetical protein